MDQKELGGRAFSMRANVIKLNSNEEWLVAQIFFFFKKDFIESFQDFVHWLCLMGVE